MSKGTAGGPEQSRPIRVIAVCLGNICRSPMAEAVLRAEVLRAGLGGRVVVDSAGTGDWHVGRGADPRARAALARRGYALEHIARQFDNSWFQSRDLILAMDRMNARELSSRARSAGLGDPTNLALIRSFDPHSEAPDVPDPYYGGPEGFEQALDMLEAAASGVVRHLQSDLIDRD